MAELKQRSRKRAGALEGAPRTVAPRSQRKLIAILSRKASLYSTRRLVEAASDRGHRAIVVDTMRCIMVLVPDAPKMIYRGVELRGIDVAIPRIGASITGYGMQVVNHLDMMGVPVVASSAAIFRSRDKLRCLQLLSRSGLDIPRTVMAHDRSNVPRLVDEVGGLPAIIKLLRGTQGVGVMLASTMAEVEGALQTFGQLGEEIFLQEFVRESEGRDVRALVVGERVVGAMRRTAKKGEFRSNLHRGGEGTPIELPRAYAEAAVRAARVIGLQIAGVDMLESATGPKIMEVNCSPGLRGLEQATRKDIAGWMVEHALSMCEANRATSKQKIS